MKKNKPYSHYRDSGVEWLGKIPKHWNIIRVKHLSWFKYGESLNNEAREEGIYPVYGSNGKVGNHSQANTHAPCIIIGRKGSFGKVNYSTEESFAIDTTFYIDDTSTKCYVRWLFYCLSVVGLDSYSQDSAVPGLSREYAHNLWLPKIPFTDQRAIANFLDREIARIDVLMAKYQRLIELLEEKRTSLISQIVTKGLDESVEMKDSGVEWLGKIPKHWNIIRVKHLSWFKYGESLNNEAREEGIYPVYGSNGKVGNHSQANTHAPCIIIGRKGSFGKVNYSTEESFAIDTTFYIDDTSTKCYVRWLFYCLSVVGLDSYSQDSAVPGLSREYAHNLWLPKIPFTDQRAIADFLDRETARIDLIKEKNLYMITKLQEYRTALISAAVTGKIDVRN